MNYTRDDFIVIAKWVAYHNQDKNGDVDNGPRWCLHETVVILQTLFSKYFLETINYDTDMYFWWSNWR